MDENGMTSPKLKKILMRYARDQGYPHETLDKPEAPKLRDVAGINIVTHEYDAVIEIYGADLDDIEPDGLIATITTSRDQPGMFITTMNDNPAAPTVVTAHTPAAALILAEQTADAIIRHPLWKSVLDELLTIHRMQQAAEEFPS